MAHVAEVAITPSVLRWAIDDSGLSRDEICARLNISADELRQWEKGDAAPSLASLRRLAALLRRQTAVFFLSAPPIQSAPRINLRLPPGQKRASLNPSERRFLREATRLQRVLGWLGEELETGRPPLPKGSLSANPEHFAATVRGLLNVPVATQLSWRSPSEAFNRWRDALEHMGIFVFVFPLGRDSSRGFSQWNEFAPVVAINSAWNVPARVFTLFHEVAHLATRTDSACVGHVSVTSTSQDTAVERWCERFAAAFLLPATDVADVLTKQLQWDGEVIHDLALASGLARRFKVSLRAAVIRLIELKLAERDLYQVIPPSEEDKPQKRGGPARTRPELKEVEFGPRSWSTFRRAINEDLITQADALTFLDVRHDDIAALPSGA